MKLVAKCDAPTTLTAAMQSSAVATSVMPNAAQVEPSGPTTKPELVIVLSLRKPSLDAALPVTTRTHVSGGADGGKGGEPNGGGDSSGVAAQLSGGVDLCDGMPHRAHKGSHSQGPYGESCRDDTSFVSMVDDEFQKGASVRTTFP